MIVASPSSSHSAPRFFQDARGPLELFVRLRGPQEHHVYVDRVGFADFERVFGPELAPLSVRITRMPASLLNPNYWEPLTRQAEQLVREKVGGAITRSEGDRTLLWRADSIAAGRYLRDDLNITAELVPGMVFRVYGESLLAIGRAWSGAAGERFEWIGLAPQEGATAREVSSIAREDLSEFRFSLPDERVGFSSTGGGSTRLIFADRALARRAAGAAVRGFALNCTSTPLPPLTERVCDQILRVVDGVGWSAHPDRDYLDKHRTFEITTHLGRTEWGLHLPPGHPPLIGNEKALVYYDRSSGIWAVAT